MPYKNAYVFNNPSYLRKKITESGLLLTLGYSTVFFAKKTSLIICARLNLFSKRTLFRFLPTRVIAKSLNISLFVTLPESNETVTGSNASKSTGGLTPLFA